MVDRGRSQLVGAAIGGYLVSTLAALLVAIAGAPTWGWVATGLIVAWAR